MERLFDAVEIKNASWLGISGLDRIDDVNLLEGLKAFKKARDFTVTFDDGRSSAIEASKALLIPRAVTIPTASSPRQKFPTPTTATLFMSDLHLPTPNPDNDKRHRNQSCAKTLNPACALRILASFFSWQRPRPIPKR